jgi:hypothetical protein
MKWSWPEFKVLFWYFCGGIEVNYEDHVRVVVT